MKARKTAQLWVVALEQGDGGWKAAPYREDWREMPRQGGARFPLPHDGELRNAEIPIATRRIVWTAFGLSLSGLAGAPCIAISPPTQRYFCPGDVFNLSAGLSAGVSGDSFGLSRLIDLGELTRVYHLQIASLPAVIPVKRAK